MITGESERGGEDNLAKTTHLFFLHTPQWTHTCYRAANNKIASVFFPSRPNTASTSDSIPPRSVLRGQTFLWPNASGCLWASRHGEDNGKSAFMQKKCCCFWVSNNLIYNSGTSINTPECCQTSEIHCLTNSMGKMSFTVRFAQKVVVLRTLSVQTGQTASSSQPVPPVLLVPLICLRWKDLLWGRLQSRDGSASPLWRGESNCCGAKRGMRGRERKERERDKDSGKQRQTELEADNWRR